MVNERFRKSVSIGEETSKEMMRRLTLPIYSFADFNIVWLNDTNRYWEIKKCEESRFGIVAHLNYVWWFDLRKKILNVSPGKYKILFRLQCDDFRNNALKQLNFTITSGLLSIFTTTVDFTTGANSEWKFITLGVFTLDQYLDLDIALIDHRNNEKLSLDLDFMCFIKENDSGGFPDIEKFLERSL